MNTSAIASPARDQARGHDVSGRLAWLAAVLVGCSSGLAPEPVEFVNVTMTLFRPFAAGEYVFRSGSALSAALSAAPFRVFPIGLVTQEPAVPAYDFGSVMIVGVSFGQGPWCTAPRIVGVSSDGVSMTVEYTQGAVGTLACMHLAPLIAFAQVPAVPGPVVFKERPE